MVILYQLNYPEAQLTTQWAPALLYLADHVCDSNSDSEWRFYLRLCLQGYRRLHSGFALAEACFRGVLTVAVEKGKLSASQARRFLSTLPRGQHATCKRLESGMRMDLDDTKYDRTSVEELATDLVRVAASDATSSPRSDRLGATFADL